MSFCDWPTSLSTVSSGPPTSLHCQNGSLFLKVFFFLNRQYVYTTPKSKVTEGLAASRAPHVPSTQLSSQEMTAPSPSAAVACTCQQLHVGSFCPFSFCFSLQPAISPSPFCSLLGDRFIIGSDRPLLMFQLHGVSLGGHSSSRDTSSRGAGLEPVLSAVARRLRASEGHTMRRPHSSIPATRFLSSSRYVKNCKTETPYGGHVRKGTEAHRDSDH